MAVPDDWWWIHSLTFCDRLLIFIIHVWPFTCPSRAQPPPTLLLSVNRMDYWLFWWQEWGGERMDDRWGQVTSTNHCRGWSYTITLSNQLICHFSRVFFHLHIFSVKCFIRSQTEVKMWSISLQNLLKCVSIGLEIILFQISVLCLALYVFSIVREFFFNSENIILLSSVPQRCLLTLFASFLPFFIHCFINHGLSWVMMSL